MASGDFDPEKPLTVLRNHGVDFVLIGGMAAVLHGDVGVTVDVDVVPDRTERNIRSKESANREKDRESLPRLRRLLDRIERSD